jgi:LssY C-terminus
MSRRYLLLTTILFVPSLITAQSAQTPAESTFRVSPTSSWTDTALDLQPGQKVTISAQAGSTAQGAACDPAGASGSSANSANLPLPSASPGALIARLAQGAAPVLVGAHKELNIDTPSHLLLGINGSGPATCEGGFKVSVEVSNGSQVESSGQQKTRGAQLKSQLSNAAQIFMSGQFGTGKSDSNNAVSSSSSGSSGTESVSSPPLHVSDAKLDADLRKSLDGLPRRVNDQLNNLGDMVNFVIVGSEKDVQAALQAANWHIADTDNRKAVLNAVMQTYDSKDYLAMPMSTLFLFGRKQDFGYEMAEPIAMVASRHHFRIWKSPITWHGQEVWVGAGTHDIGFAKDKRNNSVTHKIDPSVDGERDNIGSSLQKANKGKTFSYYLPPNPVQDAKNATGDGYHSDGRLLVILLQ